MYKTTERCLLFSIQTKCRAPKNSHKSLSLPPSAGSDDFRLLCDCSSRHSFPISHMHTQSLAASNRQEPSRQISVSLCPVKVSPKAQKTIYCKHLSRYGLLTYGHFSNVLNICLILFLWPSLIWCCVDGEMDDGVRFIEILSTFVRVMFLYFFGIDIVYVQMSGFKRIILFLCL